SGFFGSGKSHFAKVLSYLLTNPDPDAVDWVVAKLARPVAKGDLWERLREKFAEKTIAVTTIGDLRRQAVTISQAISWERTAQDLYWELTNNPAVSALSTCAHTVVSLGPAGALVLSWLGPDSTNTPRWDCRLIFDPEAVEGEWEAGYPGGMIGYTTCLTTAIVAQLLSEEPNLTAGAAAGVSALRKLHLVGYGEPSSDEKLQDAVFPLEAVAREAVAPQEPLPSTEVRDPVRHIRPGEEAEIAEPEGLWTILDSLCSQEEAPCDELHSGLATTAAKAVQVGIGKALEGAPICRLGNLVTVDRQEAEGYRRVRRLITQYAGSDESKPLAIAVFGPPGAGKSFGVKQVAESVAEANVEDCEFNISQFAGPGDLVAALHTVRDIGLSGKTPLVFWDEFDTDSLKWLKYFLAPIQDGAFRDGQILHHVGRAIFVFAGGTAYTMAQFDRSEHPDEESKERFKAAKGPDFVSRLKGYLNIMGPDQQGEGDRHYLLRRAVLLRSLLERNAPQIVSDRTVNIDPGVLRAFLHIPDYKHGVRSMQSIITMSNLAGQDSFVPSCLPDESQLDLHVDGRQFLALVQLPELEGELLERLAAATHEVYRGTVGGYENKPDHADAAYGEVPEHLKESNRAFVRSIFAKLRSIGYTLMPARSGDPLVDFPGEHEEALAEAEHERWMWERLGQGYRYGKPRDDERRINPNLIPWEALSDAEMLERYGSFVDRVGPGPMTEKQKQWDRNMVASIPDLLAEAGYTLVRLKCTDNTWDPEDEG
ncbi:MAG: RyR domain-containing protein, partial [Armatimonadota bacterium]